MDRKVMEWLGAMLLIDGIASMFLLLVALLNVSSSPWVVPSVLGFIVQHPDLLALTVLAGPSAVFILGVSRKAEEALMSIIASMLGLQRQDRGDHKPKDGEI